MPNECFGIVNANLELLVTVHSYSRLIVFAHKDENPFAFALGPSLLHFLTLSLLAPLNLGFVTGGEVELGAAEVAESFAVLGEGGEVGLLQGIGFQIEEELLGFLGPKSLKGIGLRAGRSQAGGKPSCCRK